MGGAVSNEGRVEVCFNNQFGTICDDNWGDLDAEVACAQLGFSREGQFQVKGLVFWRKSIVVGFACTREGAWHPLWGLLTFRVANVLRMPHKFVSRSPTLSPNLQR